MSSEWFEKHLLDALDGTLGEAERKRFDEEVSRNATLKYRWDELQDVVALTRKIPSMDEPGGFTERVMSRLADSKPSWWMRAWTFLSRPRQIRVNLLGALSGAAAMAVILILLVHAAVQREVTHTTARAGGQKEYIIRFTYSNPEARQVYVTGSFNNWQEHQLPMADPSGRGVWVALVPVKPGSYEYMFLVDGKWVSDRFAQSYKDDGFGRKNAILNVSDAHEVHT